MFKVLYSSIIMLMAVAVLASCTKTEYDHQKQPYNDIKVFTIAGSYGAPVKGLVKDDTITVYWNPDVAMPATITPEIIISDKAVISPASGTAVSFKDTTTYTVTAEDGSVRKYRLQIALNVPTPVLKSTNNPVPWLNTTQLTIAGEYFLANTDTSQISVYMQRMSDGIEIPLTLIKNRISNYTIVANLPTFSAEQDTGIHRLFVKAGYRIAQSIDVRFVIPAITNATYTSSFVQDGQALRTGDSLQINYALTDNLGGAVSRYYTRNTKEILLYTNAYDIITVSAANIRFVEGAVRFKLPDAGLHKGKDLFQYRMTFNSVLPGGEESSSYSLRGFFVNPTKLAL
ncbi:hypothetical protein ACLOAU_18425 [Niabella sp. CJ426]|uniref:hypothetical protein n=1 Tax=Niabella sp. CJ426 TaxID=3393740 RepID=UPI003CFD1A2D